MLGAAAHRGQNPAWYLTIIMSVHNIRTTFQIEYYCLRNKCYFYKHEIVLLNTSKI